MHYPLETSQQLGAVLRALRQSRNLTQAQLGERLGVNQKRIARIESEPGVTSFDQIARIFATMGHRLVLEEMPAPHDATKTPNPTDDASW